MIEKSSLKGLNAYIPGKPIADVQKEFGLEKVVKLASNENPFGSSKKVQEALSESLTNLEYYPDGGAKDLKSKLAEFHQIEEERLLIGSGLDEVIQIVSRALLTPNDQIIVADPTFSQYEHHAVIEGSEVIKVPVDYETGEMDLDGMLAAITDKTKIIWLCNPNNPTGSYLPQAQIKEFVDKVPNNILVISDEAYQEYVTIEKESTSFDLLETHTNLMIMRTFSKAYGLAGLRIGYAIMPKSLEHGLEVVRLPFNTNTLAQKAAIVALADQDFIEETVKVNQEELLKWEAFFTDHEVHYYVSQANFIFFDVKQNGLEVAQKLMQAGFIVRGGLRKEWLRITIGHAEDNQKIREVLTPYLS